MRARDKNLTELHVYIPPLHTRDHGRTPELFDLGKGRPRITTESINTETLLITYYYTKVSSEERKPIYKTFKFTCSKKAMTTQRRENASSDDTIDRQSVTCTRYNPKAICWAIQTMNNL